MRHGSSVIVCLSARLDYGLGLGLIHTFFTGLGSSGINLSSFAAALSIECLPVPKDTCVTKSLVTVRLIGVLIGDSGDGDLRFTFSFG